jgi:hypothetical protein
MVLPRSLANTFQTTLVPTTRSPQSFALAKIWLQEYSLKHPECQGGWLHNQLPTRLVHVRQKPGNSKLIANICNGSMLPPDTSYLSLSHCWGKIKLLTTTQSNISEFQISIPIHKLSRVFQDALLVTNELGFEYIWIDSFCVVQDDIADWTREVLLMGIVYRNASCNISASAFASGEEGLYLRGDDCILPLFFSRRTLIHQYLHGLKATTSMASCINIHCKKSCGVYHFVERGHCKSNSL